MAKYVARTDSWVSPLEEAGTLQNAGRGVIEVSSEAVENTGIRLSDNQMITFTNTVYVRSASNTNCTFTTVPFSALGKGGELFKRGVFNYSQKDADGSYNKFFAERNSGGGNQYYNSVTNTLSYIGVNKPTERGADVDVQIYSKDATTNVGTRLNISSTKGIYYLKDGLNIGFPEGREVAVKENLDVLATDIKGINDRTVYTSSESEAGIWIDGSVIYKKTYSINTPQVKNEFVKSFSVDSGINLLLDIEIMGDMGLSGINNDPIKIAVSGSDIYCKIFDESQVNKVVYITIRYTKDV